MPVFGMVFYRRVLLDSEACTRVYAAILMGELIVRLLGAAEKSGGLGVLVSALGCAGCFPALGSLGAALGLGFLARYEGLFINTLLPMFALISLVLNLVGWLNHGALYRGLMSVAAPVAVLLALYPLWEFSWSTSLFYGGLVLMLVVAIVDIFKPAQVAICRR